MARCEPVDITLEVDDNYNFSSPTQEIYTGLGSDYTTSTSPSLHNKRWLRYKVDLDSCSSDTAAPILNSIKLNYE